MSNVALRTLIMGACVTLLTPLLMGAAEAPPEPEVYIYHPESGERTYLSDLTDLIPSEQTQSPGTITPMLIDTPTAYAACFGVGTPQFPDFPLRSYGWVPQATGTVYLQCGPISTKTYGWHHIQDRHQNQWQARVNAIPSSVAWDDFMEGITRQVLDWPDNYTKEYGGKRCYTSMIQIWTTSGTLLYTFNPSVVVSMTNNRVITSYAPDTTDCRRFAQWWYE
ncbi:hypothetical protein ASF40_05195 [Microbacterium sp. Leaf288]|uniref:hypothetical protein n=1 Tax=Microbacterium sp. Leaf288 TaxID=1736323 RepID=UPI0006F7E7A2|nr:hypothetical protein [Microbacterium sp. Leaf288]KQP71201.1 hypothetical protein ASF40_05195 [Microbacterium sp. Leaf288]